MDLNFFKTDTLSSYIGEYLLIKIKNQERFDNFLLEGFIKEEDNQPYTANLFLKHKFHDICVYTITSNSIEQIYVYDIINYDLRIKNLIFKIGDKNNICTEIINYIYDYLRDGKVRIY